MKTLCLLFSITLAIATWTQCALAISYQFDALNQLTKITYDNGSVVQYSYDAAGNMTAISSSGGIAGSNAPVVITIPAQSMVDTNTRTRQFKLQLVGTPNNPYVLEAATNLTPPINWQPVFTNYADANGNWLFTDTNLHGGQLFYRTRTAVQ